MNIYRSRPSLHRPHPALRPSDLDPNPPNQLSERHQNIRNGCSNPVVFGGHDRAFASDVDLGQLVAPPPSSDVSQQLFVDQDDLASLFPPTSPPLSYPPTTSHLPPSWTSTPGEYNVQAGQERSPASTSQHGAIGASPSLAGFDQQSLWPTSLSTQEAVDQVPFEHQTQGTGSDSDSADASYAKVLYWILLNAPNHTLPLSDIYDAVHKKSARASDPNNKGWRNSVRHNLSMNEGFVKAERGSRANGHPALKGSHWSLSEEALAIGVESTTRYRKDNRRKAAQGSTLLSTKRQESGAKGGRATRKAAKADTRRAGRAEGSSRTGALLGHDYQSGFDQHYAGPIYQYPALNTSPADYSPADYSPPELGSFDPFGALFPFDMGAAATFTPEQQPFSMPGNGEGDYLDLVSLGEEPAASPEELRFDSDFLRQCDELGLLEGC